VGGGGGEEEKKVGGGKEKEGMQATHHCHRPVTSKNSWVTKCVDEKVYLKSSKLGSMRK
jgi:hypothetical protein